MATLTTPETVSMNPAGLEEVKRVFKADAEKREAFVEEYARSPRGCTLVPVLPSTATGS